MLHYSLFNVRSFCWLPVLIIGFWVTACSADAETGQTSVTNQPPAEGVAQADPENSVAAQHFSPEVLEALATIKNHFERGLRVGKEQRTVSYAYQQHAIRLRLDYFNKAQIASVFPFNGGFYLSEVEAAVARLPFVTKNCGLVAGEEKEVVNYYCLSLDDTYFSYLDAIADPGGVIATFASTYREKKTITPALRKKMVLSAKESLDFDDWDHQLFYCLFQCWTNEEVQAYIKVNELTAAERETEVEKAG